MNSLRANNRRLLRAGPAWAIAALWFGTGLCHAGRPLDLLRAAINADGAVPYSGRCEIRYTGKGGHEGSQVQRILRGTNNRERIEVVSPQRQAGKLIVSDGRTQWEYYPGRKAVFERQLPALAEVRQRKLDALNRVKSTLFPACLGVATVAGRRCHVIAVRPPDGKRVRKKTWLDTEKLVELKWERYDEAGGVTVSWAMTEVDYSPAISEGAFSFTPPQGISVKRLPLMKRTALAAAEASVGFRAVVPSYLPPGYAFLSSRVGIGQMGSRRSLWMHFTDGVDTFTIVQALTPKGPLPDGPAFHWEAKGFVFVMVGPISSGEMAKIKKATLN